MPVGRDRDICGPYFTALAQVQVVLRRLSALVTSSADTPCGCTDSDRVMACNVKLCLAHRFHLHHANHHNAGSYEKNMKNIRTGIRKAFAGYQINRK